MEELRIPLRKDFQSKNTQIVLFIVVLTILFLEFIFLPIINPKLEFWGRLILRIALLAVYALFLFAVMESFLRAKFVGTFLIINENGIGSSSSSFIPIPWFNSTRINSFDQIERIELRAAPLPKEGVQKIPNAITQDALSHNIAETSGNVVIATAEVAAAASPLLSKGSRSLYIIPKEGSEAQYVHMGGSKFRVPHYNHIIEAKDIPRIKEAVGGRVRFIGQ